MKLDRRNFLKLSSLGVLGFPSLSFAERINMIENNGSVNMAGEIEKYLSFNSIARKVMFIDELRCGELSRYTLNDTDLLLDDIDILLSRKNGESLELLTGEDQSAKNIFGEYYKKEKYNNNDFIALTFEMAIINKINNYSKEKILENMKKDFLKKEEKTFIDFVKKVAKKRNRYYVFDNLVDAIKEIKKVDYKQIIPAKKYENKIVGNLRNISKVREKSNFNDILLTHSNQCEDIGFLTIRQNICVLTDCLNNSFVTYEDIAMTLIGKNLTYIEIKEV